MNLVYNVKDRPGFWKTIIFAFQQLLAIMAATIVVPIIINGNTAGMPTASQMSTTAALLGAGVGTLVYLLFTKFRSPVFLGSSFAFLGSMTAAFAGAVSMAAGYVGLILGAVLAGLVYVVLAIIVKLVGVKWISKLMPPVAIGPTVALIGLSLASAAISDLTKGKVMVEVTNEAIIDHAIVEQTSLVSGCSPYVALICGLITLFAVTLFSVYGKKMMKMIPFVLGILVGYAVCAIFTVIGIATNNVALQVIDFSVFANMGIFAVPDFTFVTAFKALDALTPDYIATVAVAYVPVAFVVFAEHIADHKNLSSIIGTDLLEDPGLHRTLLGDGVGSAVGSIFGGCPNTTYGESVGCVAISGNASIVTIITTSIMAIAISFLSPFATFLASIPNCVMGGVCIALYGFIAVSGLKMIQKVDLGENKNLFVVSVILITGIGGLSLTFGKITITNIACALILGILTNIMLKGKKKNND